MNLPPPRAHERNNVVARLRRNNPWLGRTVAIFAAVTAAWAASPSEWSFAALERLYPSGTGAYYFSYLVSRFVVLLDSCAPYALSVAAIFALLVTSLRVSRNAPAGTARDPLVQLRDLFRRRRWLEPTLLLSPFLYILPTTILRYREAIAARDALIGSLTTYPMHDPRLAWMMLESNTATLWYAKSLPTNAVTTGAEWMLVTLLGYAAGKVLFAALDRLPSRDGGAASVHSSVAAPIAADEITFRAVAVTPRARAIVAAVAVLTILSVIGLVKLSTSALVETPWLGPAVFAYAASLFAAQHWFRRASTIGIGVDGVLVQGTSRTRFYAYRDFDEVRVVGPELVLLGDRSTRVRLQLHGDDKDRGELLAERIRQSLHMSKSTSSAELAVATHGASDIPEYRVPSLTRDQLWELVEGDGTAPQARTAAARTLAKDFGQDERDRLRVAGQRCADPKVRAAIEAVVVASEDEGDESAAEAQVEARAMLKE